MKKKVLFISSTGGHLEELLQLKPLFEKYDYHIITEKDDANISLKQEYGDKISFLPYGTRAKFFTYLFLYFYLCLKTVYFYFKIRPEVIVTTGTHTAGPMCILGKLLRSKIIYIETIANMNKKTATGRLIYPIADLFIVQWEEMLNIYPKAVYVGTIGDGSFLSLRDKKEPSPIVQNMVFVMLGTQNNSFHRLLEKIDELIEKKVIQEKVVVQAGYTKYESKHMKLFGLIAKSEIEKYQQRASYIITHGGAGSIMTSLALEKKVIAVPRKHKYEEHVNDHQQDIIEVFSKKGYIIGTNGVEDLENAIQQVKTFQPKKYEPNHQKMLQTIENFIMSH